MKFNYPLLAALLGLSFCAHPSDDMGAFAKFSKRFSSNEIYQCHGGKIKNLTLNVSTPDGNSPGWKNFDAPAGLTTDQLGKLLYVEAFEGSDKFLYYSFGQPSFDDDTAAKHVELKLHDGKVFAFDRFGDIPDINADQSHFNTKPFFKVTIDGDDTYQCGAEYNPS
jgi:hypothetical protein